MPPAMFPSKPFRGLPVELLLMIKEEIPISDLRTHVCLYNTCRTIAALYGTAEAQERFWRKSCAWSGVCALDEGESWKDIAFECIAKDGFCSHPFCGGALLEWNATHVAKAVEATPGWNPEEPLTEEALRLEDGEWQYDFPYGGAFPHPLCEYIRWHSTRDGPGSSVETDPYLYYPDGSVGPHTAVYQHPIVRRSALIYPTVRCIDGSCGVGDGLFGYKPFGAGAITMWHWLHDIYLSLDEEISCNRLLRLISGFFPFLAGKAEDGDGSAAIRSSEYRKYSITLEDLNAYQSPRGLWSRAFITVAQEGAFVSADGDVHVNIICDQHSLTEMEEIRVESEQLPGLRELGLLTPDGTALLLWKCRHGVCYEAISIRADVFFCRLSRNIVRSKREDSLHVVAVQSFRKRLDKICLEKGLDPIIFNPIVVQDPDNRYRDGLKAICKICAPNCDNSFCSQIREQERHMLTALHTQSLARYLDIPADSLQSKLCCPQCGEKISGSREDSLKRHMKGPCAMNSNKSGSRGALPQNGVTVASIPVATRSVSGTGHQTLRMANSRHSTLRVATKTESCTTKPSVPPPPRGKKVIEVKGGFIASTTSRSCLTHDAKDIHIPPLSSVRAKQPSEGVSLPPCSSFDEHQLAAKMRNKTISEVLADLSA